MFTTRPLAVLVPAVLLCACSAAPPAAPPDPAARLAAHVRHLAEREVPRDWTHPASLDEAAAYVARAFEAAGARVELQTYEVDGVPYHNVRAFLGPADGAPLVVGAHYDVYGELPGADDNASGVAVLLELADRLGERELAAPVELVAWTLEEPPWFRSASMGSAVHARALVDAGVRPRGVIALEMLGDYDDEPGSQDFPLEALAKLYPDAGTFLALVGRPEDGELVRAVHAAWSAATELDAQVLLAPPLLPGVDFSDHLNYWAAGLPALMVTDTAFYRNARYHTAADTPETLDYRRMAQAVEGLLAAVVALTER